MIEAVELTKSFGAVRAVRGVSFTVKQGEAVGFLGPNGAGKTTTFRMLAGTIGPSSGSVRLDGHDIAKHPIEAKRLLGYMPENPPLYPELTASEYLFYRAELKGIAHQKRQTAIERAAREVQIGDMLGTQIGNLSKGYRQRTALADALLGDPPILLLDEPTSGLDPNQVLEVRTLIKKLAEERAVVLSTHILSEVEATCHRAIVIHRGRVVGAGTLEELRSERTSKTIKIAIRGDKEIACKHVNSVSRLKVTPAARDNGILWFEAELSEGEQLSKLISACIEDGLEVLEAAPQRAALDDVFAQLVADSEDLD